LARPSRRQAFLSLDAPWTGAPIVDFVIAGIEEIFAQAT
jgi:hypothetical protein